MNKYGINFKSHDSVTVGYNGDIQSLLDLISKNDFVSLPIIGFQNWLCGDEAGVKFKSVAFRCSEIESIHFAGIEEN